MSTEHNSWKIALLSANTIIAEQEAEISRLQTSLENCESKFEHLAGAQDETFEEARQARNEREAALQALGLHPDSDTDIAEEIRRLRDENRAWFHLATRGMNENDQLKALNLEMARLAEEDRGIPTCDPAISQYEPSISPVLL